MQDAMCRVFNRFPELRTTVHVDDMKLNLRFFFAETLPQRTRDLDDAFKADDAQGGSSELSVRKGNKEEKVSWRLRIRCKGSEGFAESGMDSSIDYPGHDEKGRRKESWE